MDRKAIAEDVVGLWDDIERAWKNKHDEELLNGPHVSLFERAHSYIIHKNIGAEHAAKKAIAADPSDREHCNKCGRAFTDKEMKFLDDQPSKERICYHCTKGL